MNNFSDTSFRSSVMFPYRELKNQSRFWVIMIATGEDLYFNHYPFSFPSCFLGDQSKYDLQVKLKLIQIISVIDLKKTLYGG